MNNPLHVSVMLHETIAGLNVKPFGTYVDCTAGAGGHSLALAQALNSDGRLLALDQDATAVLATTERLATFKNVTVARGNFTELRAITKRNGITQADGILYDLGVSSMQLDRAERGFSYVQDAPLDMRMDQRGAVSAADLVNKMTQSELANIFKELADSTVA